MRLRYILLALLLSVSFIKGEITSAQTLSLENVQNVKISQLSDQQVMAIWQKFQASGLSEEAAYQLLMQRGLPPTEVEAFRKRLVQIQSSGLNGEKMTIKRKPDSARITRDTITPSIPQQTKSANRVYGFDFFNNSKITFEPNLRIATPQNYILGPDDELVIMVTGLNETTITRKISPDGTLQIPYAGLVYLNGFNMDQAGRVIREKLQKIYPAIRSGTSQMTVNLGNVRSIRVTIVGEAKLPGTYSLSSLGSVFNALYLSGGPAANGSLRNIELIRNNRVFKTIDLYDFLQRGLMNDNISLRDQDIIRFPVYKKRVAIEGAIKRPAVYELRETETLEDLINYAGGFSDDAYRAMAKVSQFGNKERSVRDVPSSFFDRYVPLNADSVFFEAILNRFKNRVFINGAVYRPGTFELTQGLSLMQLIEKADGLREDAFLTRGYIKRTSPDLEKEVVSFDLRKIKDGIQADIPLFREDSVTILSTSDLREGKTIAIDGYVRKPGSYTFRQGMTIQDLVAMAGGFSTAAASHRIEISRILKDAGDMVANQLVKTYTVQLDSALYTKDTAAFKLEPLDYIYVPRLVNYRAIGNVSVNGEVLFPGDYAIQKRDETAKDIIARAGGLTPSGSLEFAQVFRKGVRVDVDLAGKSDKFNANALIIMPGDSIVVPRENLFVEVSGAVNTPQLLRYARPGFKYYINAAGGGKQNASLKRSYIQYANGINRPVRHFLFFRNYPRVEPGSKIIVPEKQADLRLKLGLGEVSAMTSVLTALIGLIAILGK